MTIEEVRGKLNEFCGDLYISHAFQHDKSLRVWSRGENGEEKSMVCLVRDKGPGEIEGRVYVIMHGNETERLTLKNGDELFMKVLSILVSNA